MALRKDGKPKKKGGWHLAKYRLVLEPKKELNQVEAYESDKIATYKAYKDKQTLRRM